jgi:hypothetical protein
MNVKEISKHVINYILEDVNVSLSRLGISEPLVEIELLGDKNYRQFETAPIKLSPMIFKKIYVAGTLFLEEKENNDFIMLSLRYSWTSFGGGSNGTELGSVVYRVEKKIPENDDLSYYIKKERGIGI